MIASWLDHWVYDWGGANVAVFRAVNDMLADRWLWLAEAMTRLGSYWGAPVALALVLGLSGLARSKRPMTIVDAAATFIVGLVLALGLGALAKHALAFPRPSYVLGPGVYRAVDPPDSRYSLPSGHSLYVGVVATVMWPLVGERARLFLLLFAAAVGWSRVALGAHFPADVLAGWFLGWASVLAARWLTRRAIRMRTDSTP